MPSRDFLQISERECDRILRLMQRIRRRIIARSQLKFGEKTRNLLSKGHFVIQSNYSNFGIVLKVPGVKIFQRNFAPLHSRQNRRLRATPSDFAFESYFQNYAEIRKKRIMLVKILKVIGILILGALGALLFNFFALPYMAASLYFDQFQFVRNFKQDKIVVNQTDKVYIQENTALESAIERVKPAVVAVANASSGFVAGLVVTSDGSIITLANGLLAGHNVNVYIKGEKQIASVVKIDQVHNLALLKMNQNNLQTVAFADAHAAKLGERVFLVAPTSIKQDNWFANQGIITEISAEALKTNITERLIGQGSPLFNSAGELVGLNVIGLESSVSAIPVDKIQALLGL